VKNLLLIFFLSVSPLVFAQKFMIKGGDTLLYKETMEIRENGDTLYLGACRTFDKVNGRIMNQSDDQCLRQGLWVITDASGNYWTGNYHNNHQVGIWKRFDRKKTLLKEIEKVSIGNDTYKVKEVDYVNGVPVTLVDRKFLSFYLKNLIAIMVIFFSIFFGRVFVNSRIYNLENGTNFSPIVVYFPGFNRGNLKHSLLSTFTFWFYHYKPESRPLVLISNSMSAIALTIFIGIIAGLIISGGLS
jgi:hypothetical protein